MNEEVNQRVISLSIRAAKLTADVLARALRMLIEAERRKSHEYSHGKQSLKHLMDQNAGATSIEVDEGNIKSFDRVARKYHIDYAIKKDRTTSPPKYMVFFKGRDQDTMTMAFREFVDKNTKQHEKQPFEQVLRGSKICRRRLTRTGYWRKRRTATEVRAYEQGEEAEVSC